MINEEILKYTPSSLFLVPLLNIGRTTLSNLQFINSFLYNGESEDNYETDIIYLLFKPNKPEEFNSFVDDERDRSMCILEELDYPDGLIMLCYELPKQFKEDYTTIWEGRYSETSSEYKKSIPKIVSYFNNGTKVNEISLQHMIFSKDENLRKAWENFLHMEFEDKNQELWEKPTIVKETFKLENYIK